MRIAVMTEVEADRAQAHMINVVKTAGGFVRLGHDTMLLCRPPLSRATPIALSQRYAEPDVRWHTPESPIRPATPNEAIDPFARWAVGQATSSGADLIYARSFRCALAAAEAGLPVVCETHAYINDPNPLLNAALNATRQTHQRIDAIITISHRLKTHYVKRGAAEDRVFIVPDGVDLDLFARPRKDASLGPSPFADFNTDNASIAQCNVLYSGHLYDHKGIPTLIEAAKKLDRSVIVHLLGGLPEDVARVRECVAATTGAGARVIVHGPVSHAHVPPWLWHANVLVLPPSRREPSCQWTSPIKLAEYLAAGTPIVASKIPALRDWVDDRAVTWFKPDNPTDLARRIREAADEPPARRLARQAHNLALAERFSYPNRARAILDAVRRANQPPANNAMPDQRGEAAQRPDPSNPTRCNVTKMRLILIRLQHSHCDSFSRDHGHHQTRHEAP